MNYKRLACYDHCPGTFGYTYVYTILYIPKILHENFDVGLPMCRITGVLISP